MFPDGHSHWEIMDHIRHFILLHNGDIDPHQLRAMISAQDAIYDDADIFDLRAYPSFPNAYRTITLDMALASLVRLRFATEAWVRRHCAIVVLPPRYTALMAVNLAQLRSFGLLGVVAIKSSFDICRARAMSAELMDAPVLTLPQ